MHVYLFVILIWNSTYFFPSNWCGSIENHTYLFHNVYITGMYINITSKLKGEGRVGS